MANIIYLKLTNPVLEVFLRWVFSSPEGPVKISEEAYVGLFIANIVKTSRQPLEACHLEGIPLHIPDNLPRRNLDRYFLFYNKYDHAAIEALLETFFYVELMLHLVQGREVGLSLKAIVISFIDQMGGETDRLNYDTIRKYITRERHKKKQLLMRAKRTHLFYNLLPSPK